MDGALQIQKTEQWHRAIAPVSCLLGTLRLYPAWFTHGYEHAFPTARQIIALCHGFYIARKINVLSLGFYILGYNAVKSSVRFHFRKDLVYLCKKLGAVFVYGYGVIFVCILGFQYSYH